MIPERRLPVLYDPDLSTWLGQVEMTTRVIELCDEQCVGVTGQ